MEQKVGVTVVRWVGAAVCAARGHEFFYPRRCVESWCAYTCIRCGALSRPLESLPSAPGPDDDDYDPWRYDSDEDDRIEEEHALAKRWFARWSWPRWV